MRTTTNNAELIEELKKQTADRVKAAKSVKNSQETLDSMAVDAIPDEVQAQYLKEMKALGSNDFWFDMSVVALDLGLRNIEARELQVCEVVFTKEGEGSYVQLNDSKQVKSFVTKNARLMVRRMWVTEAQALLHNIAKEQGDEIRQYSADTAGDEDTGDDKALIKIARKLGVEEIYLESKEMHYWQNIGDAEIFALSLPKKPKGRRVFFDLFPRTRAILRKRLDRAKETGSDYLFPCNQLPGNRAAAKGYEPTSRQTVYRVIQKVRSIIEKIPKIKRALNDIRLGLHSCRKAAVQRVYNKYKDLTEASEWIGHGNGKGDLATTQVYLDKSKKRRKEVSVRAARASEDSTVYSQLDELLALV